MLRLLNRLDLLFKVEDLIYHYCSRSSFFRSGAFNCVSACVERERERETGVGILGFVLMTQIIRKMDS